MTSPATHDEQVLAQLYFELNALTRMNVTTMHARWATNSMRLYDRSWTMLTEKKRAVDALLCHHCERDVPLSNDTVLVKCCTAFDPVLLDGERDISRLSFTCQ